jgi:hypothetical protein
MKYIGILIPKTDKITPLHKVFILINYERGKSMPGQAFAYLRVCKEDQDLEKNKADILKLANDAHLGYVQFIEEKIGGSISWRKRQIATVLENAQEGDTIIVSELSRLGRSMLECMEILSLAMQKGVHVYAVKRQLAAQQQYPEQDCRHGLCHGSRN